ncbi:MAG: NRDE family protein [Flavobacteriaceae bacterium]|nr:NRDE family protein [Flavobacteriaceae bacterium]
MCTVTIIPKGKNDFVLTSNRDESPNRTSLAPDIYLVEGTKMMFPKDELAGGTWIGVSEKNRLICLLNGGFICHERKADYRMSRGVVVSDLLASEDVVASIEDYNLIDIEPFTLVIVDWNISLKLFELVWDGQQKHFSALALEPKIWSSSTLYSKAMKKERLQWFKDFKIANELHSASIMNFHKTAGYDNKDYGVIMDRDFVKTTSITQVEKKEDVVEMRFNNLQSKNTSVKTLKLQQPVNE